MSLYLNTNIASLVVQNYLGISQASLQTSLQRLSSGLRINSAADDAAGLAIVTGITSQINGYSQASQNTNDGISMSQIAEGGMSTISDNLQRMRSLAVEAANGSNSTSDRQSIQTEIAQLQAQINQVATQTQYNGTYLLNGSLTNAQFQVGANTNQTITLSISNLQASAIGSFGISGVGSVGSMSQAVGGVAVSTVGAYSEGTAITTANNTGGALTISGNGASGSITTGAAESADQIANDVNNSPAISSTGVTASASTHLTLSGLSAAPVSLNLYSTSTNAQGVAATNMITVSNATGSNDLAGLVIAINAQSGASGITASYSGGTITLSNTTGQDITVQNASSAATNGATGLAVTGETMVAGELTASGSAVNLGVGGGGADSSTVGGQVAFSAPNSYLVTAAAAGVLGSATTIGSALNSINSINASTINGANSAIQVIDAALLNVSNQESNMGAIQNRFTSVVSNLATSEQNLTSARSHIQDTNFAIETANLARAQILQQAGIAMLVQANSLPNVVQTLLK